MSVSSTTTKVSYSGDGSQTVFAYTFKIFADADLRVIERASNGTETVKTLTTHYTVSGAGTDSGGNVTFGTAPASGVTVIIKRNLGLTQGTDYIDNDPFPAESHEDALDRLTFIAQNIQEQIDRCIKASETNTLSGAEFTIGASDRANKIFAFDGSGDVSITQEIGTFRGSDATITTAAYNVRDLIKSTTSAQLNNIYLCKAASSVGDLLTDTSKFELIVDAATAATSATNAANSATAAATSATNAATSATAAATSATNAATSETNANDWAVKTNGIVDSTDYSSKAWAIGGTGVTDASGAGSAKDWAVETTGQVDGTEYSAKEYAVGTQTRGTTGSAKDWATYTGGTVDGAEYSAKYYAEEAAASVATFDDKYAGAKADDTAADTYFTSGGRTKDVGDIYYSTSTGNVRIWNGTAWEDAVVSTTGFASNGFAIAMAIAL